MRVRTMSRLALLLAGGVAVSTLCSCATMGRERDASSAAPELTEQTYLYEVVRHLYRWYMDEADVDAQSGREEFVFWVRDLRPALDAGDRSRFGEIVLPHMGIFVMVKKADYTIEETGARVVSQTYKIVNVARYPVPRSKPPEYVEVRTSYAQMLEDLFRTRSLAVFPEGELLMRMRLAVRAALEEEVRQHPELQPRGEQIVHLAPLSPIANETWVFWETGRLLIQFSSDMDLENPALWQHDELVVHPYSVDRQVVVSLDQAAGSNAFLTRDQVGRALYNCVVMGRRAALQPLTEAAVAGEKP